MIETIFPVLLVSLILWLAYRGQGGVAGAAAGFPTTTALVSALGLERLGPVFVRSSASGIERGLLATLAFLVAYRAASQARPVVAACAAFGAYVLMVAIVSKVVRDDYIPRALIPLGAILLTAIDPGVSSSAMAPPTNRVVVRFLVPFVVAMALVRLGPFLGAALTGVVTPFPATIFPLLLFVHIRNREQLPRVIGGVARGLVATLAFALTLSAEIDHGSTHAWWTAIGAAAVTLAIVSASVAVFRTVAGSASPSPPR